MFHLVVVELDEVVLELELSGVSTVEVVNTVDVGLSIAAEDALEMVVDEGVGAGVEEEVADVVVDDDELVIATAELAEVLELISTDKLDEAEEAEAKNELEVSARDVEDIADELEMEVVALLQTLA